VRRLHASLSKQPNAWAATDGLRNPIARRHSARDAGISGLAGSDVDRLFVGVVVCSLFLERIDNHLYLTGRAPVSDLTFDLAIGLLTVRFLWELVAGRVALSRITAREGVIAGFVALVALLGLVSLIALPAWMVSSTQFVKTLTHLAFLGYAALLIGRALSRTLVEFVVKLFFLLASGVAVFAIVQAFDLNVGNGALTRVLHLTYRTQLGGFVSPTSIYSEPAYLGYACIAGAIVGVSCSRSIGVRKAAIGTTLCAVAVCLSLALGPLLVAAAVLLVLVFRRRGRVARSWRLVTAASAIALLLVVAAVASPLGTAVGHRASALVGGSDYSGRYRIAQDRASLDVWRFAPATGVGLGQTRRFLPLLVPVTWLQETTASAQFNASNAYVALLGETGPLGLIGLVVLLGAFLWPFGAGREPIAEATQTNVLAVALIFFVLNVLLLPPFWFWGGLCLAAANSGGEVAPLSLRLRALGSKIGVTRSRTRPFVLIALLIAAVVVGYGLFYIDEHAAPRESYAQAALLSQPVAYWRMNTAGPTDLSVVGTGRTAVREGAKSPVVTHGLIPGRDKALDLRGDWLQVSDRVLNFGPGQPFTVSAWAKLPRSSADQTIVSVNGPTYPGVATDPSQAGFWLHVRSSGRGNALALQINGDSLVVGKPLPTRRPAFVVATYDGRSMYRLYEDGRLVTTQKAPPIGPSAATNPFIIGASGRYGVDGALGPIDDVAVWAHALSAAEIARQYRLGR
jgi:hypothetical protein